MGLQLHDKYQEFVTESDREQFISKLQEVEDWLYEEGEDETKGVYIAKLEELKKVSILKFIVCPPLLVLKMMMYFNWDLILQQGDPIEQRYKEHAERGSVIDQLIYCIKSYREAAMSQDPKFDHIDVAEKQKVYCPNHKHAQLVGISLTGCDSFCVSSV